MSCDHLPCISDDISTTSYGRHVISSSHDIHHFIVSSYYITISPYHIVSSYLTSSSCYHIITSSYLIISSSLGFLAGDWDPTTHQLIIHAAYPCKTTLESHDDEDDEHHHIRESSHVEMDPDSEADVCSRIHAANMKVVGW